jgi:hypothetical protein
MGKKVKLVHKIDEELIDILYERAREKKGEERKKLLKQALYLSRHIGKYLSVDR